MSASTQSTSPNPNEGIIQAPRPASASALLRHFADLRDGTHGGARSRRDKERLFVAAVPLLDPHARQALEEINTYLLLGTGEATATGVRQSADGGPEAVWALTWRDQMSTTSSSNSGETFASFQPPSKDLTGKRKRRASSRPAKRTGDHRDKTLVANRETSYRRLGHEWATKCCQP